MEQIREEKGISIIEILQKLWGNRVLVVLITLITTTVLIIPLYFVNKPSRVITVGFEYNFLGVEQGRYPDGTLFDFRSLISYNTLLETAALDPQFSSIDIMELYLDEETKIRKQEDELSSERQIIFSENRYILTIPMVYFDYDEDLSTDFVKALIDGPILYALSAYDTLKIVNNVNLVDDDVEYIQSIDYYETQYNLLEMNYLNFIEEYGNVSFAGESAIEQLVGLEDRFNKLNSFVELKLLVRQEKYIKNFDKFTSFILLSIDVIDDQIALNTLKIADLEFLFNNVIAPSNLQQAEEVLFNIVQLRLQNIDLNKERSDFQEMIDFIATAPGTSFASQSFLNRIQVIEGILTEYTNKYNAMQTSYYSNQTTVVYDNGAVIVIDGGLGNIVLGLISGTFGFALAVVVVLIKDGFEDSKLHKVIKKIASDEK